jgi:hypothetical protein
MKTIKILALASMLGLVVILASNPAFARQDPAAADGSAAVTDPAAGEVAQPAAQEGATTPADPAAAAPAPVEPATEPAPEAAYGVVGETTRAVKTTGENVAEQGRRVWSDALKPMISRLVNAAPSLLKAFAILLAAWILARFLGWLVTKLLLKTDVDNRLARDWGLESVVGSDKKADAFERAAGTVVKWIVLLFGFVGFFDALDLGMVAGPLQNVLNKITSVIPSALNAAVILLGYWLVATVVRFLVTKGLGKVGFDQRVEKWVPSREVDGEPVGPSATLGRLLFYIILLLGVAPFLEALGQEALVAPLSNMLGEVFAFLPNILAAIVLLFIGKVVATIVREVVTNLLAATGLDAFAERFGFGKSEGTKRVSEIVGAVAFFFVIIPIIVAAVDSLQISAISGPVKGTLEQLLAAIPLILVAGVVFAVGYFVARAVRGIVDSFLTGVGFDALPGKLGLTFLEPKEGKATLSNIAGTVVMAIILLLTTEQALATLHLTELSALVGGLVSYLPNLLVGLAIILLGLSLGNYVAGLLESVLANSPHKALVATVAKFAIIFLTFSMGLNQLGVGEDIVRIAVGAVLGGSALALGLAFGLGGRDKAKEIVERNVDAS